MTGFYPAPKPRPSVKPPKGLRKVNKKRAGSEFARCYHSRARQKWVNLLPCSACNIWGHSQNAHVEGPDGAGRKKGYKTIAPLCTVRFAGEGGVEVWPGCHHLLDEQPEKFRRLFPEFNAKRAARATEKRWLAFCRSSTTPGV